MVIETAPEKRRKSIAALAPWCGPRNRALRAHAVRISSGIGPSAVLRWPCRLSM